MEWKGNFSFIFIFKMNTNEAIHVKCFQDYVMACVFILFKNDQIFVDLFCEHKELRSVEIFSYLYVSSDIAFTFLHLNSVTA